MSQNKKKRKVLKSKLFARVIALVLAALMIVGSLYYMIYMMVVSASAAESVSSDDINIRIGLMYGDGVTPSFETESQTGYTVGSQPLIEGTYDFTPFWFLQNSAVSVAADANLLKNGDTYTITSGTDWIAVGGYHIEIATGFSVSDMAQAEQMMRSLNETISGMGIYGFPFYQNGMIQLRVGSFVSYAQAEGYLPYISGILGFFSTYVVTPSASVVTVIDPQTNRILMEYDSSDGTSLGLSAPDVPGSTSYIKTSAGNIYDGVFAYTRYAEEGVDGVAVTNVLTLDAYVSGVLPYEMTNTWPIEGQKALAIAIRSYAANTLDRHNSTYHFDLCNGSHCQAYLGAGRINDNVLEAVQSTHGLVISYNGGLVSAYHSASAGGCTVGTKDMWGYSDLPYLVAHETPWERYAESESTFWIVEVTPSELLTYLRDNKGYKELKGAIADVSVVKYAENSTYVRTLRITDIYGTSVEIDTVAKVASNLAKFVKNANFVVGKGSVDYTLDTVEIVGEKIIDAAAGKEVSGPLESFGSQTTPTDSYQDKLYIQTGDTVVEAEYTDAMVLTADGRVSLESPSLYVLFDVCSAAVHLSASTPITPGSSSLGSEIEIPRVVKEYRVITEEKTAVASSPDNFVFVGKGRGHGVGMSQRGARDLANLGYDYEYIINAYFTNVKIVYYKMIDKLKNRM